MVNNLILIQYSHISEALGCMHLNTHQYYADMGYFYNVLSRAVTLSENISGESRIAHCNVVHK